MIINKYSDIYFAEFIKILKQISLKDIDLLIEKIFEIKNKNGRIFFLGVGGSSANCSHAVNDFRKICEIESYTPTDNVSELTARINDDGWNNSFSSWLKISKLKSIDGIFILSVGGGSEEKKISLNLIEAIKYGKKQNAKIFGIIGPNGGYTFDHGDNVVKLPNIKNNFVTPISESLQSVIWHSIVSDPRLKVNETTW